MKDEKFREELNNTSVTDMLSEEEIAAVEAMYLETLDAEVPDIWDRIEAGIRAEGFQSGNVFPAETVNNVAPSDAGNSDNTPGEKKVISLAERRRKRRTLFTAIGAAAAILIVMIPTAMFGSTRNDKKESRKEERSTVKISEDAKTEASFGMVEGIYSDKDKTQQNSKNEYGTTTGSISTDGELAGTSEGDNDAKDGYEKDQIAEDTTTATFEEDNKYNEFFEDEKLYQIKTEGELYYTGDGKLILETPTDSKYTIVNTEAFDDSFIEELKKGGRVYVYIKGDFDGAESDGKVIVAEYLEVTD